MPGRVHGEARARMSLHLRRSVGPVAAAVAPLLVAALVTGLGRGVAEGGDGPTVQAVATNGPLGAGTGDSDPLADELTGAHPVTFPSATTRVRQADARETVPAPDFSDRALPSRVLTAYRAAARSLARSDGACRLSWPLLAGIGKVESGHAYGGAVDRTGLTLVPILGPVLDGGPGVAAIPDTDDGRWDTDKTWDRAVGPMQFIPGSWVVHGQDGNGDGGRDPNNVDDAALAAGGYLCTGDRDLRKEKDRRAAVFSYNHSWDYVDLVLAWADAYASGTPVLTGSLTLADADVVGRPRGRGEDGATATEPGPSGAPPVQAVPGAGPVAPADPSEDGPTPGAGPVSDAGSTSGSGSGGDSPASGPADSPAGSPQSGTSTGGSSTLPQQGSASPTPSPTPSPTGEPTPADCPTPTDSPSSEPSGSTTPEPTPTPSPTQVDATATPTATEPAPDGCPTADARP